MQVLKGIILTQCQSYCSRDKYSFRNRDSKFLFSITSSFPLFYNYAFFLTATKSNFFSIVDVDIISWRLCKLFKNSLGTNGSQKFESFSSIGGRGIAFWRKKCVYKSVSIGK